MRLPHVGAPSSKSTPLGLGVNEDGLIYSQLGASHMRARRGSVVRMYSDPVNGCSP